MTARPTWNEVEAIFVDVVDLPPDSRTAVLEARCTTAAVRQEIESLLAAHDAAGAFLPEPMPTRDSAPARPIGSLQGTRIGRFRLLEPVGEGGMGVVYRAERADGDISERVAIKLLAMPAHTPETLRRFRTERQALATLNHPDIVTLLDGGITEAGQPYLAMKYVEGQPITSFCAERRSDLEVRIALFRRVCAAVHHAHRAAIVHRDLKPANILVTDDGAPKILDFGIAKLIDADATVQDVTATALGRPLTPNYASPEQLRGQSITTSCDVYALGVLLYELLTGAKPYDTVGKPLDEVLAIVVDRDPPRPSAAPPSPATPLPYERRRLKGDLDAIVLKAMRKDPAARYGSAQELADDLGRHVARQPVLAREPSLAYHAGVLARRHRAAFLAGAISLVALVVALGVSLRQTQIAVAERDRANARFNDVRQLANALIFKIHDGVQPLPGSTPVRQAIVAEALTYLERLSADPAADDDLRIELAKAYHRIGTVQGAPNAPNLGDREGALASVRKAIGLLAPLVAPERLQREAALEYARAQMSLTRMLGAVGRGDDALAAARQASEVTAALAQRAPRDDDVRRLLGSAHFNTALATADPAARALRWQEAGAVFDALLDERPDDPDRQRNVALVEKYQGGLHQAGGDRPRALRHYLRAMELDRRRARAAPDNRQAQTDLAIDLVSVASIHEADGRLDEAIALYEESRDVRRQLAASDPKDDYSRGRLAQALEALGRAYAKRGHTQPALEHVREAVAISESRPAADEDNRRELIDYLSSLSHIERAAGLTSSACTHAQRAAALAAKGEIAIDKERILGQVTRAIAACQPRPAP